MKILRNIINLTIVLAIVLPVGGIGTSVVQADAPVSLISDPEHKLAAGYAPDRLIVKFKSDVLFQPGNVKAPITGNSSLDTLFAAVGVQTQRPLFMQKSAFSTNSISRIHVLQVNPMLEIKEVVKILSADPNLEWAEPDYLAYPANTIPNDPYFPDQWGLAQVEAPEAWDVTTGTGSISIAIIDSGIDASHPDLASQIWVNPGEIPANGLDDDNNGYIDDINGWDFVNSDNDPTDDHGHGTQVAGVAAAATDNSQGIAGVCWDCTIMPVKVMQSSGVANYSDIAAGVLYAAQKGAKVINISLGGYSASAALQIAVQTAMDTYGSVVVAGAGNDNLTTPFYPAAYECVLAVAGTDQNDAKAGLSNYGGWIDIAAPAVGITTTFQGGDYGTVDGTSYATPFIAGVAGLLRSQNPNWSPNTIQAQILHTADGIDSLNPGLEGLLGSGRVNANQAVNTEAQPLLSYNRYTVDGVENGRTEPGETVDLDVTIYNDWADAANVQATLTSNDPYVTIVQGSAPFGDIATYESGTNSTSPQINVSSSAPYNHNIVFTLQVTAEGGYSVNLNLIVTTASSIVYPPATITTQTWTNDRIYVINKETGIPAGETLTIEPGTEIRFDGYYSINVAGELIADGTEEQPIVFTSNKNNPTDKDWQHIKFLNSSIDATYDGKGNYIAGSIINHAVIEYGRGVYLEDATPLISNSVFQYLDGVGANYEGVFGSQNGILIVNNTFVGVGIDIQGPSGTIVGNDISMVPMFGIKTTGNITITANRVMECNDGIFVSSGYVSGNLLANNHNHGIWIDPGSAWGTIVAPMVVSNTVVYNKGSAIYLSGQEYSPALKYNNIVANTGQYTLEYSMNDALPVSAETNWWGTTDENAIEAAIYDGLDEFGLGFVDYSNYLTDPEPTAPAYVVGIDISPDTTLGIQTATFDVEFSTVMDQLRVPDFGFYTSKRETWSIYDTSNSGLPENMVQTIAMDTNGDIWFGTQSGGLVHFDGSTWVVYDTTNSPLPSDNVRTIAINDAGIKWIGTLGGGVAKFDGQSWEVFNTSNSGLLSNEINSISIDLSDTKWIGTLNGGVAKFDGQSWEIFNTSNSNLPENCITDISKDVDNSKWVSTCNNGISHYNNTTWTNYHVGNSGLPSNYVRVIAVDDEAVKWFGTNSGIARFDGTIWKVHDTFNSEIPSNQITAIGFGDSGDKWFGTENGAVKFDGTLWQTFQTPPTLHIRDLVIDQDGSVWFASFIGATTTGGIGILWDGPTYMLNENYQWYDDHTYRATYDVTSLIPRGDYILSVSGAVGSDGIEIASSASYTFTVDYAGAIGDTTPPSAPTVTACSGMAMDTLSAEWIARDLDSSINLYRYAIGTTPGGSDVVNWTNTDQTSFLHSGLSLDSSQPYYVSVKARNEGGLWSPAAVPDAIYPGSGVCSTTTSFVYLPLVVR